MCQRIKLNIHEKVELIRAFCEKVELLPTNIVSGPLPGQCKNMIVDAGSEKDVCFNSLFLANILIKTWKKIGRTETINLGLIERVFCDNLMRDQMGGKSPDLLERFIFSDPREPERYSRQLILALFMLVRNHFIEINGCGNISRGSSPFLEAYAICLTPQCPPDKLWQVDMMAEEIARATRQELS